MYLLAILICHISQLYYKPMHSVHPYKIFCCFIFAAYTTLDKIIIVFIICSYILLKISPLV